jgi:putative copper export protein
MDTTLLITVILLLLVVVLAAGQRTTTPPTVITVNPTQPADQGAGCAEVLLLGLLILGLLPLLAAAR